MIVRCRTRDGYPPTPPWQPSISYNFTNTLGTRSMQKILGCSLALALAAPCAQAADVCEDPAYIMTPDSDVLRLHLAFNDSPSSRRVLNEVHYYDKDPHLTVGMGHWIDSKLAGLFHRLKQDPTTWKQLTNRWAARMDAAMWKAFEKDTKETGRDASALSRGLSTLLCADKPSSHCIKDTMEPWTHATGLRFNSDKNWFRAGWRAVSLDPAVAEHQVRYWAESIVDEGQAQAKDRGITTRGGIASVVSAVSSGIRRTMFGPNSHSASRKNGSFGESVAWPLDAVPTSARPAVGTVNQQALLNDWKSLAAWQFYTVTKATKKKPVRSRMKVIWEQYYAGTWGPLSNKPTFADISKPRHHSGCYMARGPLDISNPVLIPPTLDCAAAVPTPHPVQCSKSP